MKIIKIENQHLKKHLKEAKAILKSGGIILYPTDTLYGLGVDAFNEKAIKRLYRLKRRPLNKPMSICLHDTKWIKRVAHPNPKIEKIIDMILPGPFTIILKKKNTIPSILTSGSEKIGIRIPDNTISRELASEFPITTTSANISGMKTHNNIKDIIQQIGEVDLALDAGPLKKRKPSTVVDLTKDPPKILRKGAGHEKIKKLILKGYEYETPLKH
ncbi:MAG TPA: L-threonylcarbamoyladenylate synthase [Methanothermobacter sp.]|nr:translation factor SUA5 [Methanothermobacter sp. MT-2]HHW04451.1 threonylcarbamoyl-AMP synthase [Methanothermobacter sp.]HOK73013.1 L-threonylcarbamoyladenylate synthase [Methanothermobacter sp.]HOL69319.1 L-threonylcarbamoyladenylate synthase [Methanothermobacter sp.]HPQ04537.1 L-threonylcarbamoyladenylate synthase [Methanothermobacter sp.]